MNGAMSSDRMLAISTIQKAFSDAKDGMVVHKKPITFEALAETTGISAKTLESWISGRNVPSAPSLMIAAYKLGVGLEELCGFDQFCEAMDGGGENG